MHLTYEYFFTFILFVPLFMLNRCIVVLVLVLTHYLTL